MGFGQESKNTKKQKNKTKKTINVLPKSGIEPGTPQSDTLPLDHRDT